MTHRFEIENHSKQRILHVYVSGLMTENDRNKITIEAIKKIRVEKLNKVIWDIRESELAYSLVGSHIAIENLMSLGVKEDDFIAVVYKHNREHHEHAQNVAINRGLVNMSYFTQIDSAIDWIVNK